jgi:hypothetical protein
MPTPNWTVADTPAPVTELSLALTVPLAAIVNGNTLNAPTGRVSENASVVVGGVAVVDVVLELVEGATVELWLHPIESIASEAATARQPGDTAAFKRRPSRIGDYSRRVSGHASYLSALG